MEESGFLVEGRRYPVPSLDTFTMDESVVLYDYSGLTIEDFAGDDDDEDRARKLKHPGLIKALLHIAYQRGNPDKRKHTVEKIIGQTQVLGVLEDLVEAAAETPEDGDAGPPALTTEPEPSSLRSSDDTSRSSGSVSTNGSDEPANDPPPTGRTRSVTSPTLVPTVWGE